MHQSAEQCAAFIVEGLVSLSTPKAFDRLRTSVTRSD